MWFLYTIHTIICFICNNKQSHWCCFYLLLLVFKKEYYKFLLVIKIKTLRLVNIENCSYFFDSMTYIKNVEPSLLGIDQVLFKRSTDCVIYYIKYFKNLDSSNFIYLVFNNVDAYIEENNEDKYLIFASTDKNKEALENYTEFWEEVKYQIEAISGDKPIEYKKYFMKIKFESDNDLHLGKILNIAVCLITV